MLDDNLCVPRETTPAPAAAPCAACTGSPAPREPPSLCCTHPLSSLCCTPSSSSSRFFNTDGEGVSAEWQSSRRRLGRNQRADQAAGRADSRRVPQAGQQGVRRLLLRGALAWNRRQHLCATLLTPPLHPDWNANREGEGGAAAVALTPAVQRDEELLLVVLELLLLGLDGVPEHLQRALGAHSGTGHR